MHIFSFIISICMPGSLTHDVDCFSRITITYDLFSLISYLPRKGVS